MAIILAQTRTSTMAIPAPWLSFAVVVAVLLLPSTSLAGDLDLLQDICVADLTSS
jgi:hypothetical protein